MSVKQRVWLDEYHAEEVFSNQKIKEKINYIHQNPVSEKVVAEAENYYFSSARNYADLDSALDVNVVLWIVKVTDCKSALSGTID